MLKWLPVWLAGWPVACLLAWLIDGWTDSVMDLLFDYIDQASTKNRKNSSGRVLEFEVL